MFSESSLLNHKLWTKFEIETAIGAGNVPKWYVDLYAYFRKIVSDPSFPCTVGVSAQNQGTLLYAYTPSAESKIGLGHTRSVFIEYLNRVSKLPVLDALMAVLILFFKPGEREMTFDEYTQSAWSILQFLHDTDPSPWPMSVPTEPDNKDWAFCFMGTPLFVNVSTPSHHNRLSRNLGSGMCWVVNPSDAFKIVGANTPKGKKLRTLIRSRISAYDKIGPSTDLGWLGDGDSREWKQYILLDTNNKTERAKCPLVI